MSDSKYGFQKKRRYGGSSSSSSASSSLRSWPQARYTPKWKRSLYSIKAVSAPKSFREVIYYGDVELKAGLTATYGSVYITAAMLNNFAALTSVFDTYRINKYIVDFVPYGEQVFNTPSATNSVPSTSGVTPLATVIDEDDTTALGSLNSLYEYGTVKYRMGGKQHRRVVYPKTLVQLYESAVTSGYSAKGKQWIDMANDDVPHLGVKWGIGYPAPGATIRMYQIMVTVYYQAKDQR